MYSGEPLMRMDEYQKWLESQFLEEEEAPGTEQEVAPTQAAIDAPGAPMNAAAETTPAPVRDAITEPVSSVHEEHEVAPLPAVAPTYAPAALDRGDEEDASIPSLEEYIP